ncbi:MAG: hypothetical protein U5R31_00035 [Acidimicrobiia bacterium]|nr:hypothetical protein [Acidimicrobiia bacterium]
MTDSGAAADPSSPRKPSAGNGEGVDEEEQRAGLLGGLRRAGRGTIQPPPTDTVSQLHRQRRTDPTGPQRQARSVLDLAGAADHRRGGDADEDAGTEQLADGAGDLVEARGGATR